jgi:hypothetical protein
LAGPDAAADVWYTITRLQQFFFDKQLQSGAHKKCRFPGRIGHLLCLARGSDSDGGWNL